MTCGIKRLHFIPSHSSNIPVSQRITQNNIQFLFIPNNDRKLNIIAGIEFSVLVIAVSFCSYVSAQYSIFSIITKNSYLYKFISTSDEVIPPILHTRHY